MKVAICDDQPKLAQLAEDLLFAYDEKMFDVDMFYDPDRLLAAATKEHYDFFILDIEMPDTNGVDLAVKIRNLGNQSPIIFLTSYSQYMKDVFKVQTFDYLVKPIEKEDFDEVMNRLLKYLRIEKDRLTFSFNKETHSLALTEIVYFEKRKRTVRIYTQTQEFETILTTAELLERLNDQFVQVHHSFILNARYITGVRADSIDLKNNQIIPMSRRFSKEAKEKILQMWGSKNV